MSSILSRSKRFKSMITRRRSRRRVIDVTVLKQRLEMILAIENDPEIGNGVQYAAMLLSELGGR